MQNLKVFVSKKKKVRILAKITELERSKCQYSRSLTFKFMVTEDDYNSLLSSLLVRKQEAYYRIHESTAAS